jgi:two-component system, NarL family, sensor kinase
VSIAVALLVGLAVGVAAGLLLRARELRRSRSEVEQLALERATLVSEVLDAEGRERARVAQALHDDALQSLLAAHQDLIEAAPGRAQVTRAHEIMGVAIDRVRDAVSALHPVILEQRGLAAALEAVCTQAEHQGGFSSELRVDEAAVGASDGLVFSVARELITNAARHAGAGHLAVTVEAGPSEIVLSVSDDGGGIEPGRRDEALDEGHVGLASIVQRLEATGGSLEIDSTPGAGTRAVAHIPTS